MSMTERRTVYGKSGTPTPVWMWIFQRFSGLLLGPIVLVHALVPRAPFVGWLSALLLVLILGHAFIGLWRLAAMRHLSSRLARYGAFASVLFVLVLGVLGVALIAAT